MHLPLPRLVCKLLFSGAKFPGDSYVTAAALTNICASEIVIILMQILDPISGEWIIRGNRNNVRRGVSNIAGTTTAPHNEKKTTCSSFRGRFTQQCRDSGVKAARPAARCL